MAYQTSLNISLPSYTQTSYFMHTSLYINSRLFDFLLFLSPLTKKLASMGLHKNMRRFIYLNFCWRNKILNWAWNYLLRIEEGKKMVRTFEVRLKGSLYCWWEATFFFRQHPVMPLRFFSPIVFITSYLSRFHQ